MSLRSHLNEFNRKKSPARFSLNFESAIKYDMYSVYITDPKTNEKYVFESFDNDKIEARKWNENNESFSDVVFISPDTLSRNSFSGVYFYKAHQLVFNNLDELNFFRLLKFRIAVCFANRTDAKEKYNYQKQERKINDSIDVLAAVVEDHLTNGNANGTNLITIMNAVHLQLWLFHKDKERMKREVMLILDGFINSGELTTINKFNFIPSGKAILTLKSSLNESKRYKQNIVIQKSLVWLAIFSFLAAAASAIAAFLQLKK